MTTTDDILFYFLFFKENKLTFHVIKTFLGKIGKNMSSDTNFGWRFKG